MSELIRSIYDKYLASSGVSTDTRRIEPGMLFWGLRGERFDGSTMAQEALDRGASWAIIDHPEHQSAQTTLVDDSLDVLQELARYHRSRRTGPILGITGTNGKTTTKELIHSIMSQQMTVTATAGNYNNHIGVPLTILGADIDDDLWIIEMGTNQPGDIALLAEIASPTHALITNIGLAHLERLGSQLGIYHEKSALFDQVVESGGILFINEDDQYLSQYHPGYRRSLYYREDQCPYGTLAILDDSAPYLSISLRDGAAKRKISTQLVGDYNRANIAAALSVAHHFDLKVEDAIEGIEAYTPSNMRSQLITTERNVVILDGYNANPTSMKASISGLLSDDDDLLLIIGDMLELGDSAQEYHRDIIRWLDDQGVSYYTVGREFRQAMGEDCSRSFLSAETLIDHLQQNPIFDKKIFIKGSRGIRLERTVPFL